MSIYRSIGAIAPYPHNSSDPKYLHYFALNAKYSIEQAQAIGNKSSQLILQAAKDKIFRAKVKQATLIRQAQAANNIDLNEAKDIEDMILNPRWLSSFNLDGPPGHVEIPSFEAVETTSPEAYIIDAYKATDELGQALAEIEKKILNSLKTTQSEIDKYMELVKQYFLSQGGLGNIKASRDSRQKGYGTSDWQILALDAILSRSNNAFFASSDAKYKGEFAKWSADKTKLLVAMSILKDPNFTTYIEAVANNGQGAEIRHGDISNYSSDVLEIVSEFIGKMQKYVNQLEAIGAEAAVGVGVQEVKRKTGLEFKSVEDNIGKIQGTGNVTVTTDFSGSKWAFDEVYTKGGQSAWSRAQSRTSKSDNAALSISANGVVVTQGITVKDYKTVTPSVADNGFDMSIQSGTPLLTILAREAGLSNQLFHIYQLLAAHGSSGFYQDSLVETWNKLIEAAKYEAFLATLAGFTSELDQAFYLVFNGQIYDIVRIIEAVEEGKSSLDWGIASGNSMGFNYWTYNKYNTWLGEFTPSSENAENRSSEAKQLISQTMYETKISVKIHISQLATIASIN